MLDGNPSQSNPMTIKITGDPQRRSLEGTDVSKTPRHPPQVAELSLEESRDAQECLESGADFDEPAAILDCLQLYHDVAAGVDGVLVLTVIDTSGTVHPQQFKIGDVSDMALEAMQRGRNANVYFQLAVLSKTLSPKSRGRADDIVAGLGVVIDHDRDKDGADAILPFGIEPTFTITTSTNPCINHQQHFAFTRPVLPDALNAILELLHRKCGGDHCTGTITQPWRLPQTLNHPSAAKIARGRPHEPQPVELAGGTGTLVDPDELRRALEGMPNRHRPRRTNGASKAHEYTGGSANRVEIMSCLPGWVGDLVDTEGEGDRSGHCFHTMQCLMEHGLTDGEIQLLAEGGSFANKYRARGDLDDEITRARGKWSGEARRMRAFARQTPHHPQTNAPIDGDALLTRVFKFLGRFVAYPSVAAHVAHTLWVAHTHMMDAWDSTPRLAFLSKEPASGKTRGLEVSELLVPRAVEAVNVTPAYLFRKVADPEGRPTILYDEIDTVFGPKAKDNEEIRGLLNAGHRKGAVAGRCVVKGNRVETEEIPAYCAVAMAGLGNLPDTLLSRAVVFRMRRRAPDEKVEPFRRRVHQREGEELKEQFALWAENVKDSVIAEWPKMPAGVEDRDADVWEALLAVADQAGGKWPQRAREAAVAFVALAKESSPSLGIQLLSDLRNIFGNADAMGTEAILSRLCELEEAPWGDLKGKPLNDRALARLLKPYGVKPKSIRTGPGPKDVLRGYKREDLHDPWIRYLPPPNKSITTATGATWAKGQAS